MNECLNSETSFHFIENQLITDFWKTVKVVIEWTDWKYNEHIYFQKAVREFVKWGDLVNHSGAEIKLKNV